MDINFELYKVFYHVAKNLSFSEASNHLYISQSAVSQAIKLLEEKMKFRLFIRNTKQVKLTREGEILFSHVEQAFNFLKAGERSLSNVRSLQEGEVRIGASDTICKYYLLPYFKEFNRLYPHIKIRVTNRTSPICIELLKKGSVDIAAVNIPEKVADKQLQVTKTRAVQDVFIAGNNFAHLKERAVDLSELEQYPLLMLEKNTVTRQHADSFLGKLNINFIPEIELGSLDLLVEMAKIGLGISLVVKDYVRKEVEMGELFIIDMKDKLPPRNLGVMTNNSVPVPVAAQKFAELLVHDKSPSGGRQFM